MYDSRLIRRIVLTGFMGAGKSTIGPLLAQRLNWEFVDSDRVIESRAGKKVAQIFAQDGEAVFRTIEAEAIRNCWGREDLVLALGGGAIETESTRDLLAGLEGTYVVFLDAPLDVLVARCLDQKNGEERPVLADKERLQRRFSSRLTHYRNADITIATPDLSPGEVVDRILAEMQKSSHKRGTVPSKADL